MIGEKKFLARIIHKIFPPPYDKIEKFDGWFIPLTTDDVDLRDLDSADLTCVTYEDLLAKKHIRADLKSSNTELDEDEIEANVEILYEEVMRKQGKHG
jgi:hypothetical protein